MAALWTTVEPALPTAPPYPACPSLRELVIRPQRNRGRESSPFHSQHITHGGTCGKTRVVPQNRRPRLKPTEIGIAKYVCCCRPTAVAGTIRATGSTAGGALLVMASRFITPVQTPCYAQWS